MLYWPQARISMMEGEEDVESKPTQPTFPAYEDLLEVMSHNTEKLDLLWRCERLETLRGQLDEHFLCRHDRPTLVSLLFLLDLHTEWMFLGQSFFADFTIMETNCTNKEEESCKALCGDQAKCTRTVWLL